MGVLKMWAVWGSDGQQTSPQNHYFLPTFSSVAQKGCREIRLRASNQEFGVRCLRMEGKDWMG